MWLLYEDWCSWSKQSIYCAIVKDIRTTCLFFLCFSVSIKWVLWVFLLSRHQMVWPMLQRGCWPSWRWQPALFPWLQLSTCPTWLDALCPQTSTSQALISSCDPLFERSYLLFHYLFVIVQHDLCTVNKSSYSVSSVYFTCLCFWLFTPVFSFSGFSFSFEDY